jgi:hypothetical protein
MNRKRRLSCVSIRLVTGLFFGATGILLGSASVGAGELPAIESLDTASLGASVSSRILSHARGGFQVNDASMSGLVSGNSVTFGAGSNVSFTNTLGGNAFQNATGIVNVVQNNGNNVLIQNLVQVNLQFRH